MTAKNLAISVDPGFSRVRVPESVAPAPLERADGGQVDPFHPVGSPEREANLQEHMKGNHFLVPKATYLGSLGDWNKFDLSKANPESDMGPGIYSSSSTEDVRHNYAGFGPDMRSKINEWLERNDIHDYSYAQLSGGDLDREEFMDNHGYSPEAVLRQLHNALGIQHEGATYKVHLSLKNPVVFADGTRHEAHETEWHNDLPKKNPKSVPALIDALSKSVKSFGLPEEHAKDAIGAIAEHAYDLGSISATKLKDMFVGYLYNDPAATPNEIFKDTMQRLRFDGVVDARPYQKWGPRKSSFSNVKVPGMEGVDPDTMHFVVWNRNQIKSATGNRGTYSKAHDDITKAEGGAIEAIQGPQREQNLAEFMRGVHHELLERNGKPKRLYHGRTGDFSVFRGDLTGSRHRDNEVGDAFYFTDDIKTANWYAKSAGRQTKGGANVMPVYLRMVNPLVVDYDGEGAEYLDEDIEKAKQLGHDGVIARNINDGRVSDHFIVFHPSQIKSAVGNIGGFNPEDPDISKAEGGEVDGELEGWHGTPHEFAPTENNPLGEFDSSKIGTGEGNDAFGYGTYLAEAQGIGRHYKDQLSRRLGDDPSWWEGKKLPDALTTSEQKTYDILRGKLFKTTSGGPNLSAEESATLRSLGDKHRAYSEGIEAMKPKGFLYRVKLHPEIVNKMLDWDRPLGEQSEHVQKVFKDLMESEIWDADTRKLVEKVGIPHHQIKGSKLYELVASSDALAGKGQFGKAASEELARRGIPGIKYLDASSRRNGDGTRNFVVFPGEEKKVRIVERLNRGGMVEDSDKAIRRAMMIAKESK